MKVLIVKKQNFRWLQLLLVGIVIVSACQLPFTASAATPAPKSTPVNNNSNTLKISPLRTDLKLDPGQTGTVKVTLINLTDSAIALRAIENDFVAGDEKGTPALILDENSYAPSHSLKRFMLPVADVTIPKGASQEVTVQVVVPKTAQAGGYFGAIRFAPVSAGNSPVAVNGSVTSLILLRVNGPAVEQLTLTNFDIQQNGGTASNFRNPNDLSLFLRFQNKGNVQEGPFGQVSVEQGKKILYSKDFNSEDPRQQVLPDSARSWTLPIKGMGKFGKYTVSGTFGYSTGGQTINIQKTIWIIPTVYIAVGIGSVILLILIGVGLYIFLRSYKRRILRSSRRRY